MPKPMKVLVEVEEIAHGRLFRLLDGMQGVVSITPVGDGPRAAANGTRQKKGGAQSVSCIVLGAVIATPGITRAQLKPVIEGAGKRVSSMPDALSKLKRDKYIVAHGSGKSVTYSSTVAGKKHYKTACEIQPAKE